jgi:hypothetical protein
MTNTVTSRVLSGSPSDRNVYILVNIASDGSEETDLVVYDNSALINDVAKGKLLEVYASGSSCQLTLEWDQGTDSPIVSFDPAYTGYIDFRGPRGVSNPAGSGATGDIVLTTANLDNGDVVTLMLHVEQT